MKLILENWRQYLKEEEQVDEGLADIAKRTHRALRGSEGWEAEAIRQAAEAGEDESPGIQTVGDLRMAWRLRKGAEAAGQLAREIPGLGTLLTAADLGSLFKKLHMAGDDFKTQSGLDALNVDDNISKIVDDKIELAFLRDLVGQFEDMPDEQPLEDFKTTERIQKFIADKFGGTTVKK